MPSLPAGRNTIFDIRFPGSVAPSVPLYASRGLTGTLRPIDMAQGADKLARTVNGTLIDISAPQMRKYQLEASGSDMEPPAFDGLWPGMEVEIDCHVELAYLTVTGPPSRTAVPGSAHVRGDYTFYAPSFLMRISELQVETAEWDATYSWSLVAEEV
jgi:hypothetical protein